MWPSYVIPFLYLGYPGQAAAPPQPQIDLFDGAHGQYPIKKFQSSDILAPQVNFLRWSPQCDHSEHLFITPKGWKVPKPGPMILDDRGQLVWAEYFENDYGGQAYDLKVQKYKGEDHLTFWLGDDTVRGHGAGHFYMLNSSYDIIRKLGASNSLYADLHDLVITPANTALLMIFQPKQADVRPAGRRFNDVWNQAIWDCVFHEIDIDTEELLFEWRASEHINLTSTYSKLDPWADVGTGNNPFDWFHINSVKKDNLGNYLISARNTHAIYYIYAKTKKVLWTLGGKDNNFADLSGGHALNFAWQHDAQLVPFEAFPHLYVPSQQPEGTTTVLMSLFDNAALDWDYSYGPSFSRALLLEVTYPTPIEVNVNPKLRTIRDNERSSNFHDFGAENLSKQDADKVLNINGTDPRYTVRVVSEYVQPNHILSSTQGSVQLLQPDKTQDSMLFVGYGINSVMTQFSSNGSVLCDIHFGAKTSWEKGDVQSYRAQKHKWVGQPRRPPSAVIVGGTIYVSWNGATECRTWLLQESDSPHPTTWLDVKRIDKEGFETQIPMGSESRRKYFQITALDASGKPLQYGTIQIQRSGLFATYVRSPINSLLSWVGLSWWMVSLIVTILVLTILLRRRRALSRHRGRYDILPRQRRD